VHTECSLAAVVRRQGKSQEVRAAKGEHSMYGYEMNAATFVRCNIFFSVKIKNRFKTILRGKFREREGERESLKFL